MTTDISKVGSRKRLAAQREPYWRKLQKGRYVGYRAGADTWHARIYVNGANAFKALDLSVVGDQAWDTAKMHAEAWFAELTGGAKPHYRVDDAITDYVEHRRIGRGESSAHEAKLMLDKHVLTKFKGREVACLTTAELKKWRDSLLPKTTDDDEDPDEAMRRAKATANKYQSYFWAALELAYQTNHVISNDAWRRIKPFGKTDKARDFYPTAEQVSTLLEHCSDAVRPLARAAVLTGFRLQALTTALVADFDAEDGTLNIHRCPDKEHQRVAALSSAAVNLFKQQAKDKLPSAYLFLRADGYPWGKSHQHRPFRDACKIGKLPREFIPYSRRHYFISRALLAGVNVHALAKNVGTSPAMITKHYGKFIRADVREMLDRVDVAA